MEAGQILQIFPKSEFYSAMMETKSEKGTKGFDPRIYAGFRVRI
jgi:hypothetical protein